MATKTEVLNEIANQSHWNSAVNRSVRYIIIELRKAGDLDDNSIYNIVDKFMDSVTIEENKK